MVAAQQIHIVDTNIRRRAQLAFKLNGQGHHAHVYESIDELVRLDAGDGLILLNGDDGSLSTEALDNQLARGTMPIALYSSAPKPAAIVKAMSAGALDYLTWPIDCEHVLTELLDRAVHYEKIMKRRAQACAAIDLLSEREREVLTGLVEGMTNKAAALRLGISARTVEIHRSNVLRKLAVEFERWGGAYRHLCRIR